MQVVRAALAVGGREVLNALGEPAREIAQIVPELACGSSRPAEAAADAGQSRFRVFEAVGQFFVRLAAAKPLVVVLEDVGQSDVASLQLLSFVSASLRDSRVVIVATCCGSTGWHAPAVAQVLSEFVDRCHPITLLGLSEIELGELVTAITGDVPEPAALALLYKVTSGNPLFAELIARLLPPDSIGRIKERSFQRRLSLSIGLKAAVRRYLAPLSPNARAVIELAAVAGSEFEFGVLRHVWKGGSEELLACLEEAAATGLVTEATDDAGHYRFNHAVVCETLYEDLPCRRRSSLHRSIGQALEIIYGSGNQAHLAAIAYHFARGGDLQEADKALAYAERAAESANRMLAFEEAARCYALALSTLKLGQARDDARRCSLLLDLGEAYERAGNYEDSRSTFRAAAELAQRLDRGELVAKAALGYPVLRWVAPGAADRDSVDLLERALAVVGEEHKSLRAMVMAKLASELYYEPFSADRRQHLMNHSVQLARESGEEEIWMAALAYRDLTLSGPELVAERLAGAQEIIGIARANNDTMGLYAGTLSRLICYRQLGDTQRAAAENHELNALARATRMPVCSWIAAGYSAGRAIAHGDFEEGERTARECADSLRLMHCAEVRDLLWPALIMPYYERGRLVELKPAALDTVRDRPALVYRALLALLNCRLGETSEAEREFDVLTVGGFADMARDNTFLASAAALAQISIALGDVEQASRVYDLMLPYAGLAVTFGPFTELGPVEHYLGLLASAIGRVQEARKHFEEALACNESNRAKPWLAYSQCEYAALLLAHGARYEVGRARKLAEGALRTAKALGMARLRERAASLVAQECSAADHAEHGRLLFGTREEPARPAAGGDATSDAGAAANGSKGAALLGTSRPEAWAAIACGYQQAEAPKAVLRRTGDFWTIDYQGVVFHVRHVRGLSCLAHLVQRPGVEVHANQLALIMERHRAPSAAGEDAAGGFVPALGDAGPALDAAAKAAYKHRLAELREELEAARTHDDDVRQDELEREIGFLTAELSRSVGLGGRIRRTCSASERARLNVTKALKSALARIAAHHDGLGQHLLASIKTGTFCMYRPDPRSSVLWQVSPAAAAPALSA